MTAIALAQLNPVVGDIAGNSAKILAAYHQAKANGADLVITPELSLIGYTPQDRLLMPSFREEAMQAAYALAKHTKGGPALIIGCLWEHRDHVHNAALLLDGGEIAHVQTKTALPNYGVFDEKRWFTPGQGPQPFTWRGKKLGLLICEDIWEPSIAPLYKRHEVELVIVINASPFEVGKLAERRKEVAAAVAKDADAPLIYLNLVCGQDDLIFDGGSFALSAAGSVVMQMPQFAEAIGYIQFDDNKKLRADASSTATMCDEETVWEAMKLGLHDYVGKNGFPGVVLGLSGGIDSAITAALAVDALGASNVKGVLLPSPYTSKDSVEDALETARLLGIETMNIPITPSMNTAEEVLSPLFKESGWMTNPATGGTLQACAA
jgi:NAD+ synthase